MKDSQALINSSERGWNVQEFSKKDSGKNYFIFAFSNILFADETCFEKSTEPLFFVSASAFWMKVLATFSVNVGILFCLYYQSGI